MRPFVVNGRLWSTIRVPGDSDLLIDRTGMKRIAVTDPGRNTVFISADLHGEFLERVMIHEVCHCVLVSYGLIPELHDMAPGREWDIEEWVCNLVADYGCEIIHAARTAIRKNGEVRTWLWK